MKAVFRAEIIQTFSGGFLCFTTGIGRFWAGLFDLGIQ
jgi:hypothetical protein